MAGKEEREGGREEKPVRPAGQHRVEAALAESRESTSPPPSYTEWMAPPTPPRRLHC